MSKLKKLGLYDHSEIDDYFMKQVTIKNISCSKHTFRRTINILKRNGILTSDELKSYVTNYIPNIEYGLNLFYGIGKDGIKLIMEVLGLNDQKCV